MTRTFLLSGDHSKAMAAASISAAPMGYVCTIGAPKRNLAQNAKLWAMLTDISMAQPEGRRMTPEQWKAVMMNACGWEVQFLEGLNGQPFPAGFRSSQLSKSQMADLITFIQAQGDEWGVQWTKP